MTRALDLTSKVAIVTGAAGGIGAATCRALAEQGAVVIAADRDSASAQISSPH
jgi:NAD(P)-dependent dehydrogenase (short-subunit alcohol dehydrogenase family)